MATAADEPYESDDALVGTIDGFGSFSWVAPLWCPTADVAQLGDVVNIDASSLAAAIQAALKEGSATLHAPLLQGDHSLDWHLRAVDSCHVEVYAHPPAPSPDIAERATTDAPLGLAVIDHDARLRFVNVAFGEIFGQPRARLLGRRFTDLLAPADRSWALKAHQQLVEHRQQPLHAEHMIRRPSGEQRVIHLDQSPVRLPEGPAQIASAVDVTQERHGSRRISESELRWRELMDTIPGAIFQIRHRSDSGYRIDYMSEGLRTLGGFSAGEDLTDFNRWRDRIPVSARDGYIASLEHSRIHLSAWTHEWPIETPSGVLWLKGISQPQVEADGSVVWNGAMFDITDRKDTEKRLDQVETDYRVVFDQTTEGLYRSHPDGQLIDVNWPLVRMHGCESKQDLIDRINDVARDWYADPEAAQQLRRHVEAQGEVEDFRSWIQRAGTGELFLASESARAAFDADGNLIYYQGSVRDVTDGELMSRLASRRSEILELIARSQPIERVMDEIVATIEGYRNELAAIIYRVEDGMAQLQVAPSIDEASRAELATQAIGEAAENAIGYAIRDSRPVAESDRPGLDESTIQPITRRLGYADAVAMPILTKSGTALGALVALARTREGLDDQIQMVLHEMAQIAAIAFEQSNLFEQLLEKAQFDALTGLPNRLLLDDRMRQMIHDAERHDHAVAALMLDLDEFKLVNDTLGHAAGDQLLQQVGERLTRCLRASDTVARFGGDEFVIIIPVSEPQHANQVCERVLSELHPPILVDDRELIVRTSIGVSVFPYDGNTPDVLLQAADTALYSAKGAGRNQYHYFANQMDQRNADRLQVERELRTALDVAQLELFCQPAVAVDGDRIVGGEILLRWQHPERGLLAPGEFLPIAEQSSLIAEIDKYVIYHAAEEIARMQRTDDAWLISVNVSARMLQSESFEDVVADALRQTGASPGGLELEITETVVMTDFEDAYRKLVGLKQLAPGIRVAMDDFGSGYSSLQYLKRLPIDTLKIDRGFVADIGSTDHDTATSIIKTIIELGHSLGLSVVAEGVETSLQVEILQQLACDRAQGFWYAAAIDASSFIEATQASASAHDLRHAIDNQ